MKRRAFNLLLAFDQFVFVMVTLGAAHPDEAPSAAAWRLEQSGKLSGRIFRPLIDAIFARLPFGWGVKDHCRKAFESELARLHLHPAYRQ